MFPERLRYVNQFFMPTRQEPAFGSFFQIPHRFCGEHGSVEDHLFRPFCMRRLCAEAYGRSIRRVSAFLYGRSTAAVSLDHSRMDRTVFGGIIFRDALSAAVLLSFWSLAFGVRRMVMERRLLGGQRTSLRFIGCDLRPLLFSDMPLRGEAVLFGL